MKLLALTLMTLFCAGLTSVTGQNEYCQWDTFNATCTGAGERISITSARYGRMKVSRCTPANYSLGCIADVSDIVGRRCNGQTSCDISLPDDQLAQRNTCRRDLSAYLEVNYQCVSGSDNEYCMWDTFNATCTGANEIISITSARYGRMRVGRCLTDNYMLGCSADVSDIVKSRCDGNANCAISLPDQELHRRNRCRRDLVPYLEVDYKCVSAKLNGTLEERVEKLEADNKKLMSVLDDFKSQGYVRRCRICFNEAEGSSQCQGVRRSCSEWSSTRNGRWTEPFRDVTDYRPGGCVYQWRVECQ